jgi:ketosteroid isomerase-like protein
VSAENVDTVVNHFALRRERRTPPASDFHPGVELWTPDTWPDGRHHVGVEAIASLFERYYETWTDISLEWEQPFEMGNKVLIRFKHKVLGRSSEVEVEHKGTAVYGFRDGKIAWMGFFFDDQLAQLVAQSDSPNEVVVAHMGDDDAAD